MWRDGAFAFSLTPYCFPCFIISGSSKLSSLSDGATTPYPKVLASFNATSILSYSRFTLDKVVTKFNSWLSPSILNPLFSSNTV